MLYLSIQPTEDELKKEKILHDIACHIINISCNRICFSNGKYVNSKKEYNVYLVDNVEFSVNSKLCCLLMNGNTSFGQFILNNIQNKVLALIAKHQICVDIFEKISDQYINKYKTVALQEILQINNHSARWGQQQMFIKWYLYTKKDFYKACFHNYNIAGSCNSNDSNCLSLTSIVIDDRNIFKLPNGYKSYDWPSYKNLHSYNKSLPKRIKISRSLHIFPEIMSNFQISEDCKKYFSFSNAMNNYTTQKMVPWIKFDDLNLYEVKNKQLDNIKQIANNYIIPMNKKKYYCAVSNLPIFEDCYVLDIYERVIYDKIITKHEGNVVVKLKKKFIRYNKPQHLLISPTIVHDCVKFMSSFSLATKCFGILYRSYCLVSKQQIINTFTDKMYKRALLDLCKHHKLNITNKTINTDTNQFKFVNTDLRNYLENNVGKHVDKPIVSYHLID